MATVKTCLAELATLRGWKAFFETISAWASEISNWMPIVFGIISLLLCFPVLVIMPEPHSKQSLSVEPEDSDSDLSATDHPNDKGDILHYAWRTWRTASILGLFKDRNMMLAFPIFFIGVFRGISLRVLLQYTPVRFGWKLSQVSKFFQHRLRDCNAKLKIQTNAIITIVACVNLLVFFFALPGLIKFLNTRFSFPPQVLNIKIIRYSLSILVTGSVLMALAPTSALLIIGKRVFSQLPTLEWSGTDTDTVYQLS
ncbi:MAG: hypothetical protein LQ338_004419 [Usnochroma carphineum]|nr:MAG: hypothetical protein LQ338_004419 [Usnochroma carphineum]